MEDSLVPPVPPAPTTLFLTRRRSHLDSASYRTLSRLFSHCLHHRPSQLAAPAPLEVEPAAANPICDESPQGCSVPPEDAESERGKDLGEEETAVRTSVIENPSPAAVDAATGNPIADPAVAPQRYMEHQVAGVQRVEGVTDMVVGGNVCRETVALLEELGAEDVLRSMKDCLEGEVDELAEPGVVVVNDDEHLLLDTMMTNFSGLIADASGGTTSMLNYGVSGGEPHNDGNIAEGVKELGAGTEEDRPMGDSDQHSVDGGVVEEGEIEGDMQALDVDESDDSELEDADDEELGEDFANRVLGENESSGQDIRCLNLLSTPKIKGTSDLVLNKEGYIKDDALKHVTRAQAVSYDEIVEWNETPLPDTEAPKPGKRKRHLTEERKAKKTKNKRVKRAQQRIADGVKRLKLAPVIKPKPVKLCHFYMHGKCQQGNACKFSHDTTPLTKSKPCTHFARGSCLKGDDCPYDHELSKYPCHNFVENGMCFRGDKCKFSHVVPTADGPSKPDAKKSDASLVSEKPGREQTSSQKASTVHDGERVTSAPTKHYSILKNLAGISVNALKASTGTPKGVQFRPSSKDRSNSSMLHQDALPIEKHMYTNGSKHQNFGGPQAEEGDKNGIPNKQRSAPLFDEKNSSKEASSHPSSDPERTSLPTGSTTVLGSLSTQHEVSEASRILQEFLFGAGS
ncbi:hypothetical protein CFC21_047257 [Triticum aestivum]|uniref:C3H1-type domain-containing protein n=2 Tax=Triticum aestivum TaxID=4565 RepID=A0A9R1FWK6_WHEAT|nr:zinc finger CCCH domain-containing protein 7-like [Triticum aestivum]XP_044356862.1 zinc finger CCCH domain-containing protein 7-like [Triticum aestivum]XP_044356863.1 zinc finger CCCH domain-containing protein 7-like [Triticum aestivum]XP_044356864.1 zinc finger CCCH domain-containing protein 7-like [Triticum aestivum]XP_044356865.1 zinc finger CCCH domain-containing protein 7-like [Triticum aestivum]XP_044356866.1 zinc finger CCCH domain-containing protein 7-like [Triticum aestivum]XP_04